MKVIGWNALTVIVCSKSSHAALPVQLRLPTSLRRLFGREQIRSHLEKILARSESGAMTRVSLGNPRNHTGNNLLATVRLCYLRDNRIVYINVARLLFASLVRGRSYDLVQSMDGVLFSLDGKAELASPLIDADHPVTPQLDTDTARLDNFVNRLLELNSHRLTFTGPQLMTYRASIISQRPLAPVNFR